YYDDRFPADFVPKKIQLDKIYPSAYSGIQISENIAFKILIDLGFGLDDRGDHWEVEVPSFRVDIYGKQDMVEEIIRVYGYDRLTSEIPKTTSSIVKMDVKRELNQEIRNHLTSIGFFEVMNYIFISPEEHSFFSRDRDFLEIRNPLGKDFSILRKSLFPGLLKNILLNFNHSIPGVGLFEYGNQFGIANQEIQEKEILAIGASGQYQKENWKNKQGQEFDFFIFKSLIFSLFSKLKISLILKDKHKQFFDRDCSFSVFIKGQEVGHMGILKKEILDWYKLEKPVMLAEFFVSGIIKNIETKSFQMWNKYPSYDRDLSFLMNKNLKYSQLEAAICELKPDSLENHTLFDRYQGKGIPEDKISLSMTFSYSNNQKILINEEINEMHTNFINKLIKKFDLIQR
ncbi:MAG: hypothetical protein KAT17_07400, partial [Candidatus Aminicenantes bacterium]|nr:hypothetical protein [Candidatus Aminicenantes bacterium]